jgi:putative Holliday junction resolvase
MKVLGVDFGEKRVGVASGDSVTGVVFPKTVIKGGDEGGVLRDLLELCGDGYDTIVFGLPLDMDDEKGEQYQKVFSFVEKFREQANIRDVGIMVETVDERLSSFEADQLMEDFKGKKVRMKEGDRDILSAKIILERWIELKR